MQALAFVGVLVPAVIDELLHLLGVARVDRKDFVPVSIENGAAGQLLRAGVAHDFFIGTVVDHVGGRQAAAVQPAGVLVDRADGQHIRDVDVVVELDHLLDARFDEVQALHVDRCAGGPVAVDVDGARHAAHQVVRMRVLAAEDGVHLDPFLLQVECFEVVGDRHQVGFGRQHIGLVAPVAVHEGAQLAALDELLQPVLDVAEVAGRRHRVTGRHGLLQFRGLLRIGLQRRHDVHPVERVQVIEMHRVVVFLQRLRHDFADQVSVLRNRDAERIFHGAHRGQRVAAGAHAADAFDEGPGVPRVAALQDHFEAAPHGAGRHRVADDVVLVYVDLATHVAFDAGNRVDDDAPAGVVHRVALSFVSTHLCILCWNRVCPYLRRRPCAGGRQRISGRRWSSNRSSAWRA